VRPLSETASLASVKTVRLEKATRRCAAVSIHLNWKISNLAGKLLVGKQ
jgi:hypothetical protein